MTADMSNGSREHTTRCVVMMVMYCTAHHRREQTEGRGIPTIVVVRVRRRYLNLLLLSPERGPAQVTPFPRTGWQRQQHTIQHKRRAREDAGGWRLCGWAGGLFFFSPLLLLLPAYLPLRWDGGDEELNGSYSTASSDGVRREVESEAGENLWRCGWDELAAGWGKVRVGPS